MKTFLRPDLCPAHPEPFHPARHSPALRSPSPSSAIKCPYPAQLTAPQPAAPPPAPAKVLPPPPQTHSACSFCLLSLGLATRPLRTRCRPPSVHDLMARQH